MDLRTLVAHAFFALFLIGVARWMRKRLRSSSADRGAKIRHILFVLYLLYAHWTPFRWVIWASGVMARGGFAELADKFRIHRMIISGDAGLALWLVMTIMGAAVMGLVVGMARCKPWARGTTRALLPYIYVVDSLMTYLEMAAGPGTRPVNTFGVLAFSQVFFAIVVGWIYVWMHVFYRSERSSLLFSEDVAIEEPGQSGIAGTGAKP